MQITFGKGKQATHGFMPFADVYFPDQKETKLRFYKRKNTVKAILRRVEKQKFPKGTVLKIPNWFVGYADLIVVI